MTEVNKIISPLSDSPLEGVGVVVSYVNTDWHDSVTDCEVADVNLGDR